MAELVLAAIFFLGTHLGIAGTPLRGALVSMVGERLYLGLYALLSLIAISWLADSYKLAPYVETWGQLYVLQPLALALTLPLVGAALITLLGARPNVREGFTLIVSGATFAVVASLVNGW